MGCDGVPGSGLSYDACAICGGNGETCADDDNDGFVNTIDQCSQVAGPAGGCPDADGDGVHDIVDSCLDVAGLEPDGCPPPIAVADFDADGFPDETDGCPWVSGPLNGCPNSDGDEISDYDDACPNEYADTTTGCPEVNVTEEEALPIDSELSPSSEEVSFELVDSPGGSSDTGEITQDRTTDPNESEGECTETLGSVDGSAEPTQFVSATGAGSGEGPATIRLTLDPIVLLNHMILHQNVLNAQTNLANATTEEQRNERRGVLDTQVQSRTTNMDRIETAVGNALRFGGQLTLPANRSNRYFGRTNPAAPQPRTYYIIWRHYDVPINRCGLTTTYR